MKQNCKNNIEQEKICCCTATATASSTLHVFFFRVLVEYYLKFKAARVVQVKEKNRHKTHRMKCI